MKIVRFVVGSTEQHRQHDARDVGPGGDQAVEVSREMGTPGPVADPARMAESTDEKRQRRRHERAPASRDDDGRERRREHGAGDPPHLLRMRDRDAHAGDDRVHTGGEKRNHAEHRVQRADGEQERDRHPQPSRTVPHGAHRERAPARTNHDGRDDERDTW